MGEPTREGIRLTVRLTHEDIASARCTTRVIVTLLMGKLQQQGLIGFDSKKYMIFIVQINNRKVKRGFF